MDDPLTRVSGNPVLLVDGNNQACCLVFVLACVKNLDEAGWCEHWDEKKNIPFNAKILVIISDCFL